ncbi:MAG: type II toxin-antitoxin system RelE/ParE family toxin [Coriobacteriia bacterium]|nr:type II toxin-antitoxin system RelE/ParE family toxin [Coriobacteriia bacterium]
MGGYELEVAASAERRLERLPERLAAAMVEFMTGPLVEEPFRVGKPLRAELLGFLAARRGAYRIVYEVVEERSAVVVVRVEHRAHAYRPG